MNETVKTSPRWLQSVYYLTVFVTGAAVLIFEVAAVRLLAPQFGASLYVLSSVLSVILAALSVGYFVGGRVADRLPYFAPLYTIISAAGVVMLILYTLGLYLIPISTELFSLMSGPLILAFLLFFVPAFLLGMDSPYIIRILGGQTSPLEHGKVVGSVFFWSTIGSIIGSLLAGFWLIPTHGLLITIVGTALLITSYSTIASFIISRYEAAIVPTKILYTLHSVLLVIGITLAWYIITFEPHNTSDRILLKKDGYYSELVVFERTIGGTTYRLLRSDSNVSSGYIPGQQELIFSYTKPMQFHTTMVPEPERVLALGAGAFTLPRYFNHHFPAARIDVVDVEPELFNIARTYFELPQANTIHNHVMDARVFLQATTTTWDVIVSDVMNAGLFIPPHVSTVEFFTALKNRLHENGVLYINFIGALHIDGKNLTDSMIKTIGEVFPNHVILATSGQDYKKIQNLLFVARHNDREIIIPDDEITLQFSEETVSLSSLLLTNYPISAEQVLFTDNKNPLERLLVQQLSYFK